MSDQLGLRFASGGETYRIVAIGLAMFFPSISGADPWTLEWSAPMRRDICSGSAKNRKPTVPP